MQELIFDIVFFMSLTALQYFKQIEWTIVQLHTALSMIVQISILCLSLSS